MCITWLEMFLCLKHFVETCLALTHTDQSSCFDYFFELDQLTYGVKCASAEKNMWLARRFPCRCSRSWIKYYPNLPRTLARLVSFICRTSLVIYSQIIRLPGYSDFLTFSATNLDPKNLFTSSRIQYSHLYSISYTLSFHALVFYSLRPAVASEKGACLNRNAYDDG